MNSFGQAPQVVKAVAGAVTEPYAKDQEGWKNNEWNGLFFYRGTGSPMKLCVTDGTNAGTIFVANLSGATWKATIPAQDFMYIITNAASFSPSFTSTDYIYRSDGTAAGTSLVYTMPGITSFSTTNTWTSDRDVTRNYSVSGNTMYFGGYDATNGNELWVTDGTAAGTHVVKDLRPGTGDGLPQAFCRIGNEVFFTGIGAASGRKLWKTDGTAAGTTQVPVAEPFFILDNAVGLVNNKMIFYAHNTVDGYEPYVSDGTGAGTFMLKNINPAGNSWISQSQNAHLRFNNKYCFFVANNGTANALWSTDGTTAGTVQLTTDAQNVFSGVSGGSYTDIDSTSLWMIEYNASGSGSDEKLYRSNGTPAGTYQVTTGLSYAQYLKIYKGALWMASRNTGSPANVEPWRSGGNAATTNKAFEIAPGLAPVVNTPISANPYGFFVKNGKLYFFASSNASPDGNLYQYTSDFTFTYSRPGNLWSDSANWTGMMPPGITDSVVALYVPGNYPVINGRNAWAGTFVTDVGAVITNATDSLIINTALKNPGIPESPGFGGAGVLTFRSVTNDTVVVSEMFTPGRLAVMSHTLMRSSIGSSANQVQIWSNLNIVNDSRIVLNNLLIALMGSSGNITRSGMSYIITGSSGWLIIHNIGPGGRTGPVTFPVGDASHYNPVTLTNTGTQSSFVTQFAPGLYWQYAGNAGLYACTNNAVNATWFVNGPFSGTDVEMTLQWDPDQELPGFDRNAAFLGHYNYNSVTWELGSPLTASGSGPYTITRSGLSSFSPFGVMNAGSSLPLRFLSFSADACGDHTNCLRWETANEQDVSHFVIERSTDGVHFSKVQTISAKNQPLNSYAATDDVGALTSTPVIWYRLRQVDAGGKISYSSIRLVRKEDGRRVYLYPNPATDVVNIVNWQEVNVIRLYDMNGKLAREWNTPVASLDIAPLAKGHYQVQLLLKNGGTVSRQLVRL